MFNFIHFAFDMHHLFSSLTYLLSRWQRPNLSVCCCLCYRVAVGWKVILVTNVWLSSLCVSQTFFLCFCQLFVPNCLPAGALFYVLMAGHLPHSLLPHMLHLSRRFPRLSCPFHSLPCMDLLIFPLSPFSIVPFSLLGFCFLCFVASPLAVPSSPVAPCVCDCLPSVRTSSEVGQCVFLQLLCESRRDILGSEAAVCLPLYMHELLSRA